MSDLPRWCDLPDKLVGRDAAIEQALQLVQHGPLSVVGPPGIGATTVALAVLHALGGDPGTGRRVGIVVDADTGRSDLVLALGLELDAKLPGDETSVLEALSADPPPAILLDDADLAADAVTHLVGLAPSARWILTGRESVLGQAMPVGPLSAGDLARLAPQARPVADCMGLALLAALPESIEVAQDWSASAVAAFPELIATAALPMGVPAEQASVVPVVTRRLGGRVVAQRSLREALDVPDRATASALVSSVERRSDELHRLACDLIAHTDPMDLRLLTAAARVIDDPSLAALAAAAAARIHIRSFQASEALALVRRRLQGSERVPRPARGLLRWLEGDALLTQGSHDLAHQAHQAAAKLLRGSSGGQAMVALARRCADEWAARGERERAREWLALARTQLAEHPDPRALADTLRISGNLSAQAGELVGAGALYDEALATLAHVEGTDRERAFVHLGQAAVAMARRNFVEAEDALRAADQDAAGHPLAEAAVAWRRAEVALRRGRRVQARDELAVATRGFRRAGALRGLLLCARMEGDLAAVEGDRPEALKAWDLALSLCVRTRNLAGLRRILRRRLVVEREGVPGPHLDELQLHLDRVEVLLGR